MVTVFTLDFKESFKSGIKKLKNFTFFYKVMTLFWFLGPFLYLIERSPADIWLSLISIIFLLRCFLKNEWSSFKQFWVICAICLWILSIIASLLSPMYHLSLGQSIPWIRFPLYALAAQTWFGKDRDIRIMFFSLLIISFFIMCTILALEIFLEPKVRLTWPYGDPVPGSFIAKSCLSIFCVFTFLIFRRGLKKFFPSLLILIIGLFILKSTDERTNFILVICSIFLSSLIINITIKRVLIFSSIFFILISSTIYFAPKLYDRCGNFKKDSTECVYKREMSFLNQIPIINFNTSYWGSWRSGIQQGLEKPFLGVGPGGTRHTCGYLKDHWLPGKNYCGNHPHNIYIQMFAEIGVIGLIFGVLMNFAIVLKCFVNRNLVDNCPLSFCSFVIPFAIFFPIQNFGSFYGQWGNLFIWFSIGFALSCSSSESKNRKLIDKSSQDNFLLKKKFLFLIIFLFIFLFVNFWNEIKYWYSHKIYSDNCKVENIMFLHRNLVKDDINNNIDKFCICKSNQIKKNNLDISHRIKLMNNAIKYSSVSKEFLILEEKINTFCLNELNKF